MLPQNAMSTGLSFKDKSKIKTFADERKWREFASCSTRKLKFFKPKVNVNRGKLRSSDMAEEKW